MTAIETLREARAWLPDAYLADVDAALAKLDTLLQAAERLGYAEFERADEVLVPKDDFDALAAAVRDAKGDTT